jgi:predicted Zn-dependent peptidase
MSSWYSSFVLDSGLNVLVAPLAVPSVTVALIVKTGSKNEDPAEAGVSHFLEHFVFKGTEKFPSSKEVMRAMDSIGAEHNASTSKEATTYWVKTASGNLDKAVEMIGELVCRPLLPGNLLDQEKGTILQEMAMIEDHPMSKIGDTFETLIFGAGTPLGGDIIGTKETISKMKVRQLMDYRARRYRPENCVLVVAGGVKAGEVEKLAEKIIGKLPEAASNKNYNNYNDYKSYSPPAGGRQIEFRQTDQVHLEMGKKAFKRQDPRRYVLSLLMTVLGGNASSRLFQIVREKLGLAYYVHSGSTRYEEDGYVAIGAGVAPEKASQAEAEILKIVRGLKVNASELSEAKGFALGHLALAWEESHFIAGHLADNFLFEKSIRTRQEIENNLKKVNLKDVNQLSDWLFGNNQPLSLAAIGPIDGNLKVQSQKPK